MNYPINYDFGANWNDKIKPFLDNPKIKRAIRKGINDYLDQFVCRFPLIILSERISTMLDLLFCMASSDLTRNFTS